MKTLICPTCSCSLLRQLHAEQPTWFCPQCHQEFPYGNIVSTSLTPKSLETYTYSTPPVTTTTSVESRYLTPQECHQFSYHKIQELEKLNYLKDYFLNAISHELKAPISHINLGLQMLSESLKAPEIDPVLLQNYVDVIQAEFQQESRLVNSLMTLQQVKSGLYSTEQVTIPLSAWLPTILQDFETLATYKDLSILFSIPKDLTIQADRDLLTAIVREMLSHAVQVTPNRGTIALAAKTSLGRVELQVIHSLPEQSLKSGASNGEVQNSLDSAHSPFAFQSFYQVPTSEPWLHQDVHIGLILAQNLASSLGGIIWVGQTEAQTFWMLELPDVQAQQRGPSPEDLLMGYVAYYVSRGRPVVSSQGEELLFQGEVYGYWGYSNHFYSYWRQLQQRSDFNELGLRGDLYSFREFLNGRCGIGACARCQLPVPLLDNGTPTPSTCPCDDTLIQAHYHTLAQAEPSVTQVLVLDHPPEHLEACHNLFLRNRINIHFIPDLEHLTAEDLPDRIDLVLLPALAPQDSQKLMQQLQSLPSLSQAAFIGLSPHAQACTPWAQPQSHPQEQIEDLLLTPYGGDYLAQYLQKLCKSRSHFQPNQLHWFPGVPQGG
ncbi:MAG: HAMP domain-containing sensor histidine kinase [Prochlorothrix sp.]|nr:HAMP domain-containing sensor histidine kinase [Prochlorothrix sp.]